MQDSYNLGWKLASVIHGVAPHRLLETYQQERLPVAKRLIEFDKRICSGMLEAENTFNEDHRKALEEENTSMAGIGVAYEPNMVIFKKSSYRRTRSHGHSEALMNSDLPKALRLGARLPSSLVLSHADSQPCEFQRIFKSTGEWNLVVFGGDISVKRQRQRVENVAKALASPNSTIQKIRSRRRTFRDCMFGSISIYLLHSASRTDIDIGSLPEIFRPIDDDIGFDYGKVFADNQSYHVGGGKAYEEFGILPSGCLVLLRPDQHIAFKGELDHVGDLEQFLQSFQSGGFK